MGVWPLYTLDVDVGQWAWADYDKLQARMAIARALITKPEVLLLDEPCSNLDPASTKLIEAMISTFISDGGSVFISTHDLAQAKRLADVVLFIEAGQLLEHGPADEFFAKPATPQAQTYLSGDL